MAASVLLGQDLLLTAAGYFDLHSDYRQRIRNRSQPFRFLQLRFRKQSVVVAVQEVLEASIQCSWQAIPLQPIGQFDKNFARHRWPSHHYHERWTSCSSWMRQNASPVGKTRM